MNGIGNSHRPEHKALAAPKRELCGADTFTKYHKMGMALGVAAGPDSVAFSSKTKPKEEGSVFLFPLKVSLTLIWYFTQGLKTKRSLRFDVERSTKQPD